MALLPRVRLLSVCALFGCLYAVIAGSCPAATEEDIEVAEAAAAETAQVQLLQRATRLDSKPGRSEQPVPTIDGNDHDELRPKPIIMTAVDKAGNSVTGSVQALTPFVNHTAKLELMKDFMRNASFLQTLGNSSRKGTTPITWSWSDGTSSDFAYCPSDERMTLFGGTPVSQYWCEVGACSDVFYGSSCGPYWYTPATPGVDTSRGVCKCCTKYSPTIYKSSQGNKVYSCR